MLHVFNDKCIGVDLKIKSRNVDYSLYMNPNRVALSVE